MAPHTGSARERARLAALEATGILDTAQESCFDSLTALAAKVVGTPISLVSLVDEKRQWFKSRHGFGAVETPRDFSFCSRAIESPDEPLIIEDATKDERFADNPLVVGPPNIRFYAGVPLVTQDGYALGTLCVIDKRPRGISEQQLAALTELADHARAQLEVRRSFAELEILNKKLALRAEALAAANEALEAFAYSASHDLRAPLRRIGVLADEVTEDDDEVISAESRQNLSRIREEAARTKALVDDLLQLGRATTVPLDPGPVDLGAIAGGMIERLRTRDPERAVEFSTQGDLHTHGDAALLEIALSNLLENAWKFTAAAKPARILVAAEHAADGTLIVRVEDNGIGFDPLQAKGRLFTPFQRLGTAIGFRGTGVGLAIVRRIVERHGGKVWAEGVPGAGATFHFTLPASREAGKHGL